MPPERPGRRPMTQPRHRRACCILKVSRCLRCCRPPTPRGQRRLRQRAPLQCEGPAATVTGARGLILSALCRTSRDDIAGFLKRRTKCVSSVLIDCRLFDRSSRWLVVSAGRGSAEGREPLETLRWGHASSACCFIGTVALVGNDGRQSARHAGDRQDATAVPARNVIARATSRRCQETVRPLFFWLAAATEKRDKPLRRPGRALEIRRGTPTCRCGPAAAPSHRNLQ